MKATGEAATLSIVLPPGALTVTAAPPTMVSQVNIEATCGLPPKAFLQLLRAPGCPLRPTRVGKLRLVRLADLITWLEATAVSVPPVAPTNAEEPPSSVLAELGLEPAPRRRGGRS